MAETNGHRRVLTAEELLGGRTLKREDVPAPELGEGAVVPAQELSLNRRIALWQYMDQYKDDPTRGTRWTLALFVIGAVNDDGEPLLAMADVETLGDQSPALVERVSDVVMRLSGLNRTEEERPLDGAASAASSSDSPSPSAAPSRPSRRR